MRLDIYHVDTFTSKIFGGNGACVCPLKEWIDDNLMQKIALENNQSATAFFVKNENRYDIKWFTPKKEVMLCGHATLASAYIIFNYLDKTLDSIIFDSKSGILSVNKDDKLISLNLPASMPELSENNPLFTVALGIAPLKILQQDDYILIYENEEIIKNIEPDFEALKNLDLRGVCISAKGDDSDFVYRFFAPKYGINEDNVTGSICSQLVPFWAQVYQKNHLKAKQLSKRGGEILCKLENERVEIKGEAILYMKGQIII